MSDRIAIRGLGWRGRRRCSPAAWSAWWRNRDQDHPAERTDRALAAWEAGATPDTLAGAFGAPAARLAHVAGSMWTPAPSRDRAGSGTPSARPGRDFVARLQDELLAAYDERMASGAGSSTSPSRPSRRPTRTRRTRAGRGTLGEHAPVGRRSAPTAGTPLSETLTMTLAKASVPVPVPARSRLHARMARAIGWKPSARRSAASLAIAASVAVGLFARIDSGSIGGRDSAATAVAATGTSAVTSSGTPIAFGTEVPVSVSAEFRADG